MSLSINPNIEKNFKVTSKDYKIYVFRSGRFFVYNNLDAKCAYGTYGYDNSRYYFRTFYSENYVLDTTNSTFSYNDKVLDLKDATVLYFDDNEYEEKFINIDQGIIDEYYKAKKYAKNISCLAPVSNINLSSDGNIGLCNVNSEYIYGKWPQTSLKDAWFSEKRKKAAQMVLDNKLDQSCCCHTFFNKTYNIGAVPMDGYDNALDFYDNLNDIENNWPINIRFQLGIRCNMKCIMCGEHASSLHRKEKNLPEFISPFEQNVDKFLIELEEFIPHLKKIILTGGESFLQPMYYKIFDLLIEKNYSGRIYVFSNGSIFNSKIKSILNHFKNNIQINLSIDSFNKLIYEKIRSNGNYEKMLENLFLFKESPCDLRLSVTAMKQNSYDMIETVKFCDKHNIKAGIYPVFTNHSYFEGNKIESTAIFDMELSKIRRLLTFYNIFAENYYNNKDFKETKISIENKKYFYRYIKDLVNYIEFKNNEKKSLS